MVLVCSLICWLAVTVSLIEAGPTIQAAPTTSSSSSSGPNAGAQQVSALQAHLNAMQVQAQRQLGQLNGIMINAANLTSSSSARYSNVLEALSNVGKAIQQQISAANNHIHIVTSPTNPAQGGQTESANNKKVS